jgi:hypothetical protein
MDYESHPKGTMLRADAEDGRYTAVRIEGGWLGVKKAGTPTQEHFETAKDWMAQIPGSPEIHAKEPQYNSKVTSRPIEKRSSDVEHLLALMRSYKIKKAVHVNHYSTNEMIQYLRERDAQTPYLWAQIQGFKNKAAAQGPETAARRYGYLYTPCRLFVIEGGALAPITVAQTKMAGNLPYEYEGQDVIVYKDRVGTTFAEVGLEASPNLWYISTKGETEKLTV